MAYVKYAGLLALLVVLLVGCAPTENPPQSRRLYLSYRGQDIEIGVSAMPLIGLLGNDFSVMEAASCAGKGTDYVYTYPSLRLYVFAPDVGEALVTAACYTDDGATTLGVSVGSSKETVAEAFGEPDEQTETAMIYGTDDVTLIFSLRDGAVTGITLSEQ